MLTVTTVAGGEVTIQAVGLDIHEGSCRRGPGGQSVGVVEAVGQAS